MDPAEKRKYERVLLPQPSGAYVEDAAGKRLGPLRVIGQGGLFVECNPRTYQAGQVVTLRIVDRSESIERSLSCEVRYSEEKGIGFAFDDLGPDAAVEIGVIIGKYYSADKK